MSRRPLIGIPGRRAGSCDVLRYSGTITAEAVCEAIWSVGGEPVTFHGPAATPAAELADRVRRFDAIVLPGGADVGPGQYGQVPRAEVGEVSDFQDAFDLGVARALLASRQPALAVCRGMQVLNVASGGTLVQHLAEGGIPHHQGFHEVTCVPGTRLSAVVGAAPVSISSYHHQAVDRVGAGWRVAATAPDGVVEAMEHESSDILAVQWHPEDDFQQRPHDQALFADLVERAHRMNGAT